MKLQLWDKKLDGKSDRKSDRKLGKKLGQKTDWKLDRIKWSRQMLSVLLIGALVLGGCSSSPHDTGEGSANMDQSRPGESGQDSSSEVVDVSDIIENLPDIDITFTDRDHDASYDENTAAAVDFQDEKATVRGEGVQAEGTTVTISKEGTYVLRGSCADGQIIIDAGENDKIQLVLDGLQLSCETFAPLYVRQADKVFLTLAEGSTNSLQDREVYEAAEEDANVDGVIFSRADLTINGSGTLTVTGLSQHGIVSKDDLTVTGGQVTVKAVGGGMYGKDCVKVSGGTIQVDAGKDAIQSDNSEKEDRGYVYLAGGSLVLNAGGDGIQAETVLQVDGGELHIQAGGGSEAANPQRESTDNTSDSAKGLKAGGWLLIKGGDIDINSADDALHSNGAVVVWDGTLRLSTGDDGLHADGTAAIYGGEIQILTSYEGIEGSTVEIGGGNIWLMASADGINAAGGSDDGDNMAGRNGGRFGLDQFKSSENSDIRISGGTLYINAAGDGLDANGSLYLLGGTVYVDGPTSGGDGALDYDKTAEVSGGTIVAVCSAGMAQGFSDSSSQASIIYQFDSRVEASQTFELTDSQGNVLISRTPEKSYQVVVVSSPQLEEGETYVLTAGDQKGEVVIEGSVNGNISGGGMPGGGRPGRVPDGQNAPGGQGMPGNQGVPGGQGENIGQNITGGQGENAGQNVPGGQGENIGQNVPAGQGKPGRPDREEGTRPSE